MGVFLLQWHRQGKGVIWYPREVGAAKVESFLTMLTNEQKVSVAT